MYLYAVLNLIFHCGLLGCSKSSELLSALLGDIVPLRMVISEDGNSESHSPRK